jgi:hypothetical protein
MSNDMIRVSWLVAAVLFWPCSSYAQGSAGTGNTSTGIGPQTGPAGPGIRRGGLTQQPGAATNTSAGTSNLSPAQKNSIPPPHAPANAAKTQGRP